MSRPILTRQFNGPHPVSKHSLARNSFAHAISARNFAVALFVLLISSQVLALEATVSVNPTAYSTTSLPSSLQLSVSVRNAGNSSITGASAAISGLSYAINAQTAGNPLEPTISAGASSSQSWILTPTSTGQYAASSGGADGKIIITGTQGGSISTAEIDIPTIAVRGAVLSADVLSSSSSPALGSSFGITVWINNNGYIDPATGVQATISLPSGLSLVSGSPSISAGSVAPGSPASLSWTLTSTSTGTKTIGVSVSYNTNTTNAGSASDSVSVTIPPQTTETPTGSPVTTQSTATAQATAATGKETRTIDAIVPGVPSIVNISKPELSVSELKIEVKNPVSNVSVSVEKLDSRPASIAAAPTTDGKVYRYLDISSTLPRSTLSRVTLKFKVDNAWISSNGFSASTTYLNRYSNGWAKLPTSFLSSDSRYSYFESESPGFSTFAISGEKPAVVAPAPVEPPKPPVEEKPVPVAPTPTALAPVVSLVTQADIDNALKSLDSVVPQTEAAKALLGQARAKLNEAQAAFNNNEQARAKQLLGEANALISEAAGLRSAAVAGGKAGIFTILLILVVLVVGVYAYHSRPPSREAVSELSRLRSERDTIVQMKKNAETEYLVRKIDSDTYKRMLSDYESRLIDVNTRIDGLSKKNN